MPWTSLDEPGHDDQNSARHNPLGYRGAEFSN
jgi:hypothetical protein